MKIKIKGINLLVKEGVFNPDPKNTNSSSMILNNLPNIKQKEILDVGCGTGIIGIYCALNGSKKVLATDIDNKAIQNTKENIKINKVSNIKVLKSDLFEKVKGSFDYIFGNLPINDKSWNLNISTVELMNKFLSEAKKHLKNNGKVFFTWNSDDGVEPVRILLNKGHYNYKEKIEKKPDKLWYLFEVSK
ncbi:MAG: methyltransferase [Nanoarchaeota archaeon]|nr:methyltransferase [Nanoarchaeota archaeon]